MRNFSVSNIPGIKPILILGMILFVLPQIGVTQINNPIGEQSQLADRLPELAAAVASNPDDLSARGSYAQALFLLGNLPAAW